ncbi:MAG: hypothetical protein JWM46_387 [Candidatus Kaiserbacteria bacterium]|nr:hypothetical protein [Candidatus Kaiserbacteria bacterium]
MSRNAIGAVAIALLITAMIFAYRGRAAIPAAPAEISLGTYDYACDQDIQLSISIVADMSTLHLAPLGTSDFVAATLQEQAATSGVRYTGGDIVLTAHGESVQILNGSRAMSCSPIPVPNEAPFNFGD